MNPRQPIAGLILSGGASSRMGTPKALLRFQNETFLDRLIRLLSEVCAPLIVVLGRESEQIRAGVERASQVTFIVNPDPDRGMLSSLQCGLEAVPAQAAAVLFTPVDHPNLQSSTLEKLVEQFERNRAPVTIPTYGERHGHPVCIARPLIAELLALPPEAQASDVIHRYAQQISYVEVDDSSVTTDVDDPAAYAGLLAKQS